MQYYQFNLPTQTIHVHVQQLQGNLIKVIEMYSIGPQTVCKLYLRTCTCICA